jgi:hypothetical protein
LKQSIKAKCQSGDLAGVKSKKIQVICPRCFKTGNIVVDEAITRYKLAQQDNGITILQVSKGDICEHEFSIDIDTQFKMR